MFYPLQILYYYIIGAIPSILLMVWNWFWPKTSLKVVHVNWFYRKNLFGLHMRTDAAIVLFFFLLLSVGFHDFFVLCENWRKREEKLSGRRNWVCVEGKKCSWWIFEHRHNSPPSQLCICRQTERIEKIDKWINWTTQYFLFFCFQKFCSSKHNSFLDMTGQ